MFYNIVSISHAVCAILVVTCSTCHVGKLWLQKLCLLVSATPGMRQVTSPGGCFGDVSEMFRGCVGDVSGMTLGLFLTRTQNGRPQKIRRRTNEKVPYISF